MSSVADKLEIAILSRIVVPDDPTFSPEFARRILEMKFDEFDLQRMNDLSEKARRGALSSDEDDEMEIYDRLGSFLGLLHSKARLSLKESDLAS